MISWKMATKAYQHWVDRGEYIQADAIRGLMIHALSKKERQAYDYIKAHKLCGIPDVASALHVSLAHAWDICKNLERRELIYTSVRMDGNKLAVKP